MFVHLRSIFYIYIIVYVYHVSSTIDLRKNDDGTLLYLFDDSSYNWEVAKEHCKKFGGSLIMITNKTDTRIFTSMMKQFAWIGLKETEALQKVYRYTDGAFVSYTNWGPNEPNHETNVSCIIIDRNSQWYDVSCMENQNLLCQIKVSNQTTEKLKQNIGTDNTIDARMIMFWLEQRKNINIMKGKREQMEKNVIALNGTLVKMLKDHSNLSQSHGLFLNLVMYTFLIIVITIIGFYIKKFPMKKWSVNSPNRQEAPIILLHSSVDSVSNSE